MWQNVDDLMSLKESVAKLIEEVAKPIAEVASPYPIIDFSKVNKRALSNLPEPERFPVLGCSPDPSFYEGKYKTLYPGNSIESSTVPGRGVKG